MQPQPRNARRRDRDSIEKAMLQSRSGGFHRHEEVDSLLAPVSDCPSFLSGKAAYITTDEVAQIEKLDREHYKAVKEEFNEKRRMEAFAREEERWATIQQRELIEQDRLKRLQEDPMASKMNSGSNPYDIVTMEYHPTPEGQMLAYHDELVRYRQDIRSAFLAGKNHAGFNCITGEQIVEIRIPSRPQPPANTKPH